MQPIIKPAENETERLGIYRLLDSPRIKDVFAASDDFSVLSLSESIVRKIIESDPETAATLMLNIAKMLCLKLVHNT